MCVCLFVEYYQDRFSLDLQLQQQQQYNFVAVTFRSTPIFLITALWFNVIHSINVNKKPTTRWSRRNARHFIRKRHRYSPLEKFENNAFDAAVHLSFAASCTISDL